MQWNGYIGLRSVSEVPRVVILVAVPRGRLITDGHDVWDFKPTGLVSNLARTVASYKEQSKSNSYHNVEFIEILNIGDCDTYWNSYMI